MPIPPVGPNTTPFDSPVESQGSVETPNLAAILKASMRMEHADIKRAPTLPTGEFIVAPAPGPGLLNVYFGGMVTGKIYRAYGNVDGDSFFNIDNYGIGAGSGSIRSFGSGFFDTTGLILSTLPTFFEVLTDPGPFTGPMPFAYQSYDLAAALNQPLTFNVVNTPGNFTAGDARNYLIVTVWYAVMAIDT